jgi:hypothetical protein
MCNILAFATLHPSNKLNMKTHNKTCEVSNSTRFNCNAMLFEPIGQKRNAYGCIIFKLGRWLPNHYDIVLQYISKLMKLLTLC